MMDKRTAALIMLDIFDQEDAPIIINWNHKEQWLKVIEKGLTELEKAETPAAGTARESK